MTRYRFITSFSEQGYEEYGREFLNGFVKHFPQECEMYVFYENTEPDLKDERIKYFDLMNHKYLVEFLEQFGDNPVYNGVCEDKNGRVFNNYRFQAIKFGRKVFAIGAGFSESDDVDWVIWIDADTRVVKDIPLSVLEKRVNSHSDALAHYLGRVDWDHSECGWVAYNRKHPELMEFIDIFVGLYYSGEVFTLKEWHDSFVFDEVRREFEKEGTKFHNISEGNPGMDIWKTTWLEEYMTHMKGPKAKKENVQKEPSPTSKQQPGLSFNEHEFSNRYQQLNRLILHLKPQTIVEVGTFDGDRAIQMAAEALKVSNRVHYWGFDLFEDATEETDKQELNVKAHPNFKEVDAKLRAFRMKNPGFTFHLIKGNTKDTLPKYFDVDYYLKDIGKKKIKDADFAFLDGGHSVKTIESDFSYLKDVATIALDDYYVPDESGKCVDVNLFGCNNLLAGKTPVLLPKKDPELSVGGLIQIAILSKTIKPQKQNIKVKTQNCVPDAIIQENIRHSVQFSNEYKEYISETNKKKIKELRNEAKRLSKQLKDIEKTPTVHFVGKEVKPHDRTALIISGGATVTNKDHPDYSKNLETIKKLAADPKVDIVCVKHSHDHLLSLGIVPYGCLLLDPRDHVQDFIEKPHPDVKYFTASMCGISTWKKLIEKNANIFGYHAAVNAGENDVLCELQGERGVLIDGGSSSSNRGMHLLRFLGFRKFKLMGYDCCYWDRPNMDEVDDVGRNKYVEVELLGRRFYTTPELLAQVQEFEQGYFHDRGVLDIEVLTDGMYKAVYDKYATERDEFEEKYK